MIRKLIQVQAVAGKEAELLELVQSLVEPSRAENGCVKYDAYANSANTGSIYIIEEWENAECLDAHKTTPHFLVFKEKGPALIDTKSSISLDQI
ncbi:putative quinol monooxygenase [Rubritalea marina]|uniref:putative quinol monooxygenase n=1 Tax=Rubritalea marina TaxID=361055 RepID=UPI00036F48DC|nr:putative quinol monooxygenase [Rubritalea marina]